MPAIVDIRRRIKSVKNTQQITKAMKMVSAAKLRRAQEAMFAARPFARKMLEVLASMDCVALSRSVANMAKAARSRYCARSRRRRPATPFMAFTCAEPPTRLTELPTLMAGRNPALNRSLSRKICPSVMEMTLVGM